MKLTFTLCFSLACLSAPALAIPLTVTIVGPDGKPLPGAKISVLEGKFPVDAKAVPRDVPGENGRFNFDWDGAFSAKGATIPTEERRFVYVRAQAPGMATQTRTLSKASSTIALQTGRSWGGLVRDAADKPVAGVQIELTRWTAPAIGKERADDETAPDRAAFEALAEAWKPVATTDAQGRWQLNDLPARANANLALNDARFVKKSYDLPIGATDAPPLFVRAGATLTGVLVRPDGAPIADTTVSAGSNGYNRARTDAQGRFTLAGAPPGEVTLQSGSYYWSNAREKNGDYLVPALQKVRAVAGETTDIGTWKAVAGLQVSAQIVDETTKKPIKDARLVFYMNGATIIADEQGALSGRILSSYLQNGVMLGAISAGGYVQNQIPAPVLAEDSDKLDLGTIELARGTVLSGTVRIEGETGTIVKAPPLMLTGNGTSAFVSLSNGKPDFSTQALKPGTYQVQLMNGGGGEKDWELISPRQISVPATVPDAAATANAKAAPIEVVLKRLTPAQPPLGLVRGVVADAQGNPIGGALVSARLRAGNSYTNDETLTNGDGSFELARSEPNSFNAFVADGVEITSIERPGYLWASQPQIETKNGATTISNLTLKKRGAVFAGRVVGADGRGAAGAWVGVLEARSYPIVQANADGKFEMPDVPLEKFTLIGASDSGFGRVQTEASAANFVLTLAPNAEFDREKLAAHALEGKIMWWRAQDYWAVLGTARLAALLERADDTPNRAYGAYLFSVELEQREPADFVRRAPALIPLAGAEGRPALEAKLFALRAASDDADDRIAANAWLDEQKNAKREINAQSVTQLLRMAIVADKLKREDAASWLDYAAAIAAQLKSGAEAQGGQWGAALAHIGAPTLAPFAEEMKPNVEFALWEGASVKLAKTGDMAGAQAAIERMETLAQTLELGDPNLKRAWNSPLNRIEDARQNIALAIAPTDAARALQLMPTTRQSGERATALLVIADRAIAANDGATATKALNLVEQISNKGSDDSALAASLAQRIDASFAAPLWADALNRATPDIVFVGNIQQTVAMWAFYHAPLDSARSRVMLEREWNWRLPAAVKTKDQEYSAEVLTLSQLEIGMAAVDPARALEMRDEARAQTSRPGVAANADIGLAAAILATPDQRARFGVGARF